jgi:methyltransferase (TIGR00027 family)
MEASRSGGTAETAAFMRALHLAIDGDPKIYEDPLAAVLIGPERAMALETASLMSQTPELTAFRAIFLVRQRFAEDELAKAVARGVRQYVILGAGLDSLAYRHTDLTGMLRILEVDHASTQQWKRRRLTERGITIPGNLTFVPFDFEVQDLAEAMASSPFRTADPAFFSWLGVTQYLSEDAVFKTLRYVASSTAAGSEIVFQIVLPQSTLSGEDRAVIAAASTHAAQKGEPWRSFLEPEALEARLRAMGFADVHHLTMAEASIRYLEGRTDELWLPNAFELITARVGG